MYLHAFENFSLNSSLDDLGISLSTFPSRTNLKIDNIPVISNLINKVVTNHDTSKASGPDDIPVLVVKNCESDFQIY